MDNLKVILRKRRRPSHPNAVESLDTMKPLFLFCSGPGHVGRLKLTSSPSTVVWGNYWAGAKPVLRIKSGDRVEILTMSTSSPAALARVGVKDEDIQPEWKDIYAHQPPREERGPGGHVLTGPIYIEGAEPGDTLEVRIQKIKLATPYAYNGFGPTRGVLINGEFKQGKSRLIPLDLKRNMAEFAPGIEIPLHPFFGSMGRRRRRRWQNQQRPSGHACRQSR